MNREENIHSNRLDVYASRLMPLLTVNELKTEIDEHIVKKAVSIVNWQLEQRKLLDPIDAEGEVAKMEERIRRQLERGSKMKGELQRGTNANRYGLWTYNTALNNLRNNG